MKRAASFLLKVIIAGVVLLGVLGVLALVQVLFHPFDGLIAVVNEKLDSLNGTLSGHTAFGVTIGTFVLVAVLAASPLFIKGVRAGQYASSFLRSTLAAGIYFLTDALYRWVGSFGGFYLAFALAFMIVLTFVLVEVVARAADAERESAVRTDLLAAIVSGLAFGIIVKVAQFAISKLESIARI